MIIATLKIIHIIYVLKKNITLKNRFQINTLKIYKTISFLQDLLNKCNVEFFEQANFIIGRYGI